ncbi:hypothetical protein CR513_48022, partial [Mucuna pruriens]
MTIRVRHQPSTTHCQCLGWDEVEEDAKPWYHDIKKYLKNGEYTEGVSKNDKWTLRRLASDFFLSGIILCKRSIDMALLWCVDGQEAKEIMEEVHEGTFGMHTNGHALARKILRAGYYWTKMESNCYQHVKRTSYVDTVSELTSSWAMV